MLLHHCSVLQAAAHIVRRRQADFVLWKSGLRKTGLVEVV